MNMNTNMYTSETIHFIVFLLLLINWRNKRSEKYFKGCVTHLPGIFVSAKKTGMYLL